MRKILQSGKIKMKMRSLIPVRIVGSYHDIKRYLIEREHLGEFQRFYSYLTNKRDIFYMFFTTGLLQWVFKALELIPDSVNIVLVGSDLSLEELACIKNNINRPFHHIRSRVNDRTVWDFLFKTNQYHFGWLDIDCFVLNPQLFKEMTEIKNDVAINGTWSYTIASGSLNVLRTYFMFLNIEVIRALKARKISVTPCRYIYDYEDSKLTWSDSRIIMSQHIKLLRQIMPTDNKGRPVYPIPDRVRSEPHFFETLVLYQLIANVLGYRINQVRHLIADGSGQEYSEELIHASSVSYYKDLKVTRPESYNWILKANFLLIDDYQTRKYLPEQYTKMHSEMREELMVLGISLKEAKHTIRRYLVNRGVSESILCGKAWQFLWE